MPFIIDINEAGTTTEVDEAAGTRTWPIAKAGIIADLNQRRDDWWTYQAVPIGSDLAKVAVFDENDQHLGDL